MSTRATGSIGGVLTGIGGTPVVALERVYPDLPLRLFAKLESLNPGGSIKDRPALRMLQQAIDSRAVEIGRTVVIESSSGNLAIGLAQVCCYYGLPLICVVDGKTTGQNLAILRAYGATIEMVDEPDPITGEFLSARLRRVRQLVDSTPGAFWPNQYANVMNARAHHDTMREIIEQLDGEVDYLFCSTSTCGTLRGCAEYARQHLPRLRIVAVDAVGSVIFGQEPGRRLIPGHGAAVRPDLFEPGLAAAVVHVTDLECVVGCRLLARREALLAGGSSGAVAAAVARMADRIPPGARCVLILPDRGERYLDTVYDDSWVARQFGQVAHLWESRPTTTSAGPFSG